MNEPLMPNLKEVLRKKIEEYIIKNGIENPSYPKDKTPQEREVEFKQHFDGILNYIIKDEIFVNFEKIEVINDILEDRNGYRISLICIEENNEIPVLVAVKYITNKYYEKFQKISYDISPFYMWELRKKSIPEIPFKDAGYYDQVTPIVVNSKAFDPYYNISEDKKVRNCFINFSEQDLLESLKELIIKFTYDINNKILIINYEYYGQRKDDEKSAFLKGIKLFKIPVFNYAKDLNKINKFSKYGNYDACYAFLNGLISFEISPEGYFEIYAGEYGFERLFVQRLFNEEISSEIDVEFDFFGKWYNSESELRISPDILGSVKNDMPQHKGTWSRINKFN